MIERELTAMSPDARPWAFSEPDPDADTDDEGQPAEADLEIPPARTAGGEDSVRTARTVDSTDVDTPIAETAVVKTPVTNDPVAEAFFRAAPVAKPAAVAAKAADATEPKAADITAPKPAGPAVPSADQRTTFADAPTTMFSRIEVPDESLSDALADLLGEPPRGPDDDDSDGESGGLLGSLFEEPADDEPVDPDTGSDAPRKHSRGLPKLFKPGKSKSGAKTEAKAEVKAPAEAADPETDVEPVSGFVSAAKTDLEPDTEPDTDSDSGADEPAEPDAGITPSSSALPVLAGSHEVVVTVDRPAPTGPRDAGNWRESIPYDDTGVLIRPTSWTDDDIETALVDVGPLREALRAAQTTLMPAIKEDEPEALDEELAELAGWEDEEAPPRPTLRERLTNLRQWRPKARHGILTVILLIQSVLSLRNDNGAFEDEGLYLYSGHLELAHLLSGAAIPDFATEFSGAPILYPILGAFADQVDGLFAARLLSLLFMLGATGLVYLTSKRLFGLRSALCSAALFGTLPAAIFLGGLATYDAPALFLLALAGWIVVRGASSNRPWFVLAVLPVVLAVSTKYASLLFVPTVIVLAGVSAMLYHRRRTAVLRPLALGALIAAVTYGILKLAGADYLQGIKVTTLQRANGDTPYSTMYLEIAEWGAAVFAITLAGGLYYAFRPSRDEDAAPLPGLLGRLSVAVLLIGTALLAPLEQLRIDTDVALPKHIGFGLMFAAPLAGYGLVRLVGDHWRRLQVGIAAWVIAFAIGATQSYTLFSSWPDPAPLVASLRANQKAGANYLVEIPEPEIYYLRGDSSAMPSQFTSTYGFTFVNSAGQVLSGTAAYQAAIKQGYFQIIALDDTVTAGLDKSLESTITADASYKLVATITEQASEHNGYGLVVYRVWVKI